MARVEFAAVLQRHVPCPPAVARGETVRDVLDVVFSENVQARGYVLDDQGCLRKHMLIFIDGAPIRDRRGLTDPVGADSRLYILQSLSGG